MPTALALWLLATGRWGSYVGSPSLGVFITEIFLGAAVGMLALSAARGSVDFSLLRGLSVPMLLVLGVLTWAIVRLGFSAALTRDTLRDFAPYGYTIVAVLVLLAPLGRWERSARMVFAVLAAHATWVVVSVMSPDLLEGLPLLGGAPLFALRYDFDASVCGIGLAVCVYWLRHRRTSWPATFAVALLALAQAALVLALPSRAGFIAALVAVVCVWWAGNRRAGRVSGRQVALRVGFILLVVPLALVAVLQSSPGERLVETVQGGKAAGTKTARQLVWQETVDYVLDEPSRAVFGVGCGPDFMHETGTDEYFEGNVYSGVRSPHNYPIGTAARLGIPGALLVLALMGTALFRSMRILRKRRDLAALDILAAAAIVAIPVVAALGVVLESPFGAVPYFWAIGHLARVERLPAAEDADAGLEQLPQQDMTTARNG